jgi:hypothetical protein
MHLVVSDVIRSNELQVWFIAEHIVEMPLAQADDVGDSRVSADSTLDETLEERLAGTPQSSERLID